MNHYGCGGVKAKIGGVVCGGSELVLVVVLRVPQCKWNVPGSVNICPLREGVFDKMPPLSEGQAWDYPHGQPEAS
jgi:hypothetical protein